MVQWTISRAENRFARLRRSQLTGEDQLEIQRIGRAREHKTSYRAYR